MGFEAECGADVVGVEFAGSWEVARETSDDVDVGGEYASELFFDEWLSVFDDEEAVCVLRHLSDGVGWEGVVLEL